MNDDERKKDYEKSANEFWRWIDTGNQLLQASNYLYTEYLNALELCKTRVSGKVPPGINMLAPLIFFRAMCLENLLKALYIKRGNPATDGNGNLHFEDHKLFDIYTKLSLPLTSEREGLLLKISESVYSWGRYPVPKNYKKWRQDTLEVTGVQPIFTWSDNDEKIYQEILSDIDKLLANKPD